MKKAKKIILLILFISLSFLSVCVEEDVRMQIPLRITDKTNRLTDLSKDDLTLTINGEKREIVHLIKKERTIGKYPGLGRNFILSFHMTDYSDQVDEGIAYFITEIIHPMDSLILVSPTTFYQINVSANKEKMIGDIKQSLVTDCRSYKKNRVRVEKNIRVKIKNLRRNLREFKGFKSGGEKGRRESSNYGVRQVLELTQFLDTFPREFIKFRELSLLLDTGKYRKIAGLLGFREGERWWLHFHQEEVTPFLSYVRGFMRELTEYVHNIEGYQVKKVANLEKVLSISDSFPVEQMAAAIVSSNFCYNVVFLGGVSISDRDTNDTETSGLERILHRVAGMSGGIMVNTISPEQGVREIVKQKDSYYELAFDFNGELKKKNLEITAQDKKIKLLYKNGFEKKELESLIHYLTHEKVTVANFSNKKNVINFTIKSYKHHQEGKYGMLSVNIELFSLQDALVYNTRNTLRSSRDEVFIKIPLPKKFTGNFKLRITVSDLLANRRAALERSITVSL
jgi:hypothetical protein